MYYLLISCLFVLQGARGNYLFPAWRTPTRNASLETVSNGTSAMYNVYFPLYKLNPAYWLYDNTEVEKLDKLYELVKCVIENDTIQCRNELQRSKKIFENIQKVQKPQKGKNSTENKNQEKKRIIQNKNSNNIAEQKPATESVAHTTNSPTTEFFVTE